VRRERAFTLVELMIVVAIIALLAAIALPAFARARQRTRAAKFVEAMRIAVGAFDQYAIENGSYPADVNRGIVPAGMGNYLGEKLDFTAPTPIGGNWDWDVGNFGIKAGVSVIAPNLTDAEMRVIDAEIDDGNLATGGFRNTAPQRFTSVIE
jgi:prepilin-type N-terminal cleavage/methylation domain-containing protein